ncbi:SgcJ/EcaC family oxidoreductase [Sphaerisporangium fuscum]|uniref:SgcJ/EcaC family oxidoreductase n=1 Tax=Sphaerisporangium fuscum TaxID=2835868 RepID=UPI001BDD79C6|nr:SgcJ/EcaC family oxidoreductase [Sphaerisporangium fuscum]
MNGDTTTLTGTDDRAVREVLHGVYTAWADNDADAFVAHFTDDATSILPGSYRAGKEEIRARMAAAFAGPLKGSRVLDEVRGVRFPGEDAAVVVSRSGVLMAGETEVPAARWVIATWVLTRREGRWLLAAYHNCPAETA